MNSWFTNNIEKKIENNMCILWIEILLDIIDECNISENNSDSGGIRTHASEKTGALNQRLRPLGHAIWTKLSQF